jgi:hypothetical protein
MHLIVFAVLLSRQAYATYIGELAKWSASDKVCADITARKTKLVGATQLTAFESQLARCLRKDEALQQEALTKYMNLYAKVPPDEVLAQLYIAAQAVVKK